MREVSSLTARLTISAVFFLACLIVLNIPASAQAARSVSNIGRRLDELNRQSQKAAQDELNRELRPKRPTREELKQVSAKQARIIHDLKGLQTEYNNIVLKLQSREPLSGSFVVAVANNVHEYSARLRTDLTFPEAKASDNVDSPPASYSTSGVLMELCSAIHSFVMSPMFDSAVVLDIPIAEKARNDLEKITRLSDHLRHSQPRGN